ncbi:MAG: hypothetical protein OEU68_03195 [Nitrospira sp.]|nr:hypothetical protein [Nitrospira sp.]MDH4242153.1 hypothetical protein [Nitrospira sp.]MDH4354731.1 hypothetical protein [Nitrospira sp.]MDH5316788.1 hypothetical protein [Nitrospira sp.]
MKVTAAVMVWSLPFLIVQLPVTVESGQVAASMAKEDYSLYDRIIEDKFLTSQIQLVLLERMTVSRLVPDQDGSMSLDFLQQQGYFDGKLPQELVRDFVGANQIPVPLEPKFQFGVRYRFISDGTTEDPEASDAVAVLSTPAWPVRATSVLDRLAFSRVGRTLENDQALVYVENVRPDETGTGFLVWYHRQGQEWKLFDTEVVWTMR